MRVVVDPVKQEMTHLVVEPEHRAGLGRSRSPSSLHESSDGVRPLRIRDDFDNLPVAEETYFLPGGSGDPTTPRTSCTSGPTSGRRHVTYASAW